MRFASRQAAACGLALLLLAHRAWAGDLAVNPVRLAATADQPVASFTVRNAGTDAALVQVELLDWRQENGVSRYTPTTALIANPLIFRLAPGATQVVRVGSRQRPSADSELAYRVIVQEVPPPPKPGFQGLHVALRLDLPLFVSGARSAPPVLRWRAEREPDGRVRVEATNAGHVHARIASFAVLGPHDQAVHVERVAADLLAGQRRVWLVDGGPLEAGAERLHVQAQVEQSAPARPPARE
jgi:fimbrial chaperone protein